MSGTSNIITPSQVLAALNLQGTNAATANAILSGSQLTGINLAALGMLLKNEVGSNVANAYSVSQPVSGGARGNSGWTIGVTQLDFNTNGTNAQQLLSQSLLAANSSTYAAIYGGTTLAAAIAQAFAAAGTSSNVDLPAGVTLQQINAALSTPPAEAVINQNADQSVLNLIGTGSAPIQANVAAAVEALTNPAVQTQLTPGSATFNATAYLALVDYANQFGGVSTTGPMFSLLNTGAANFPGGVQNFVASQQELNNNSAAVIQSGEFATKYGSPNGNLNPGILQSLGNRQETQDSVGVAFDAANGLQSNNDMGTFNFGASETISIGSAGAGDYLASYVQQTAGQPISNQGWVQIADAGQFATESLTYNTSGLETSATIQTGTASSGGEYAAQVNFGAGSGGSTTISVTPTGGPTTDYTISGTPTLGFAMDSSTAAGSAPNAILVGGYNATLTGGSGTNLLLEFGTDGTVTGGSGTNQILLAGTGDSATSLASGTTLTITGSADSATVSAGATVTVTGTADGVVTDYGNGTSQDTVYNPSSSITQEVYTYTGLDQTGSLTSELVTYSDGASAAGTYGPGNVLQNETITATDGAKTVWVYDTGNPAITQYVTEYNSAGQATSQYEWNASGPDSLWVFPTGTGSSWVSQDYQIQQGGSVVSEVTNLAGGGFLQTFWNPPAGALWDSYTAGYAQIGTVAVLEFEVIGMPDSSNQYWVFNPAVETNPPPAGSTDWSRPPG